MAKKSNALIISKFDVGQGPSPYKGFEKMVGVDLISAPGIVRCGFQGLKQSSTTITDLVTFMDTDPTSGAIFALDKSQKVYKSTDSGVSWSLVSGNTSSGAGNGLKIFKGFVFVSGTLQLDIYSIAGAFWVNGFKTFPTSGSYHPMIWGQDDILYHGSAQNVSSLQEIIGTTFSPFVTTLNGGINNSTTTVTVIAGTYISNGDVIIVDTEQMLVGSGGGTTSLTVTRGVNGTSAASHLTAVGVANITKSTTNTYVWSAQALTLPANVFVRSLEELGVNLLVGTWNAGVGTPVSLVYPWDRTSTTFRLPIKFSGDGIHAMKTIGQFTYVLHGKTGKLSYTNGAQVFPLGGLNFAGNETYTPLPGSITNHNGKLIFGFGSGITYPNGVYSLTPAGLVGNETPILICENQTTQGVASTQTIGALVSVDSYNYLTGWQDTGAGNQGVDLVAASGYRIPNYGTTIDTAFFDVGNPLFQRKFTSFAFQLEKALATGQGLRFYYRFNHNASFVQFAGDIDFATYGAIQSKELPFPGDACDTIQLRIQMTAATNSTDTPGLLIATLT